MKFKTRISQKTAHGNAVVTSHALVEAAYQLEKMADILTAKDCDSAMRLSRNLLCVAHQIEDSVNSFDNQKEIR